MTFSRAVEKKESIKDKQMVDGFILQGKGSCMAQKQMVLEGEYLRPWTRQDEETKTRELKDDV